MTRYVDTSSSLTLRFSQLLGGLSVTEKNGKITISKFPGLQVVNEINKLWKTSTVSKYMFNSAGYFKLEFNSFYAVEVKYIFERLLAEARLTRGLKGNLKRAIEELELNTWLRDTKIDHDSILDRSQLRKFKKSPLESQDGFFQAYDEKKQQYCINGYLLSSPPGSGKTLTMLFLSEMRKVDLTIILCPKIARIDPWETTLKTEFNKTPEYWVSGGKPLEHINYRYLVVHYDAIAQLLPFINEIKKKKVMICLDESHNFNDIKAERTQAFISLCQATESKDIIPASGTPVKAMATEMIPFLKATDPLFTEDTEVRFRKIFGVSKARANDVMCNRLGLITFKVDKRDVVDNEVVEIEYRVTFPGSDKYTLPKLSEEMRDFIVERLAFYKKNKSEYEAKYEKGLEVFKETLTGSEAYAAYSEYLKDIRTIKGTLDYSAVNAVIARANTYERKVIHPTLRGKVLAEFKDAKSVVKYVPLKVRGEALGRILGRRRADCHKEMIKFAQLESYVEDAVKKTLIFSSYVDVVKGLDDYFKSKEMQGRYKPIPVYADTSSSMNSLVKKFADDKKANPMIATYQTLSTAVPLTMASTVILFNQPFREYEKNQATSRVDRKGQDSPVTIVSVLLDTGDIPNISTRSMDIMKWSKEQVEQITGIKSSTEAGVEGFDDIEDVDYSLEQYDLGLNSLSVGILSDASDTVTNELSDRYEKAVTTYLNSIGVQDVEVIPHDRPDLITQADLYIAHGQGSKLVQNIIDLTDEDYLSQCTVLNFSCRGGVNHPEVDEWINDHGALPVVGNPPRGHYVLTHEQKQCLELAVDSIKERKLGLEYFQMEQTIHQHYFHISSHIPSLEAYDDLVPGLEGLFDGARRLVTRIFKSDIDKGRVEPFTVSGQLRRALKVNSYSDLSDITVMRPEGLSVPYIVYIQAMGKQFEAMNTFLDSAMDSARVYLAQLASDPGMIGSISSSNFNLYLKKYDLKAQKKEYAKMFSAGRGVEAPYHELIRRNEDWNTIDNAVQVTHKHYLSISPTAIEEQVDVVYDILNDIIDTFKQDKNAARLSKVQVSDISTMAYTLASVIEYYSMLMFSWQMANQALKETGQIVSDAEATRKMTTGNEGFFDFVKKFIGSDSTSKASAYDGLNKDSSHLVKGDKLAPGFVIKTGDALFSGHQAQLLSRNGKPINPDNLVNELKKDLGEYKKLFADMKAKSTPYLKYITAANNKLHRIADDDPSLEEVKKVLLDIGPYNNKLPLENYTEKNIEFLGSFAPGFLNDKKDEFTGKVTAVKHSNVKHSYLDESTLNSLCKIYSEFAKFGTEVYDFHLSTPGGYDATDPPLRAYDELWEEDDTNAVLSAICHPVEYDNCLAFFDSLDTQVTYLSAMILEMIAAHEDKGA